MNGPHPPVVDDFVRNCAALPQTQRAALLFLHFMEGTEDLPPQIKMEHAGKAWEMACGFSG